MCTLSGCTGQNLSGEKSLNEWNTVKLKYQTIPGWLLTNCQIVFISKWYFCLFVKLLIIS